MAVADEPFLSPSAFADRLPERDADVLHRVMGVDVQVAFGTHDEVEHPVPRELVQHVVEERHAGRELGAALAVEVDVDLDPRLLRVALDLGAAGFRHR